MPTAVAAWPRPEEMILDLQKDVEKANKKLAMTGYEDIEKSKMVLICVITKLKQLRQQKRQSFRIIRKPYYLPWQLVRKRLEQFWE